MLRNDRRDITPYERMLIRAGHHVYYLIVLERDGKSLGGREERALWDAIEDIWEAKRRYRAGLAEDRLAASAEKRERFKKIRGSR